MPHTKTEAKIHILPPDIADRIAAGEVVERPASVVKELIENSIDAGAKHVIIETKNGGAKEIKIIDDGGGISKTELALAVCRHATSKIKTASDLDAILTLGFRGEALPSIAAVSRLSLASRTKESSEGSEITVEGGKASEVRPIGVAFGTRVIVRDLFYNTPARRKFLKTEPVENSHISEIIARLALSRLDCRFTYVKDAKEVFDLPANEPLPERASKVLHGIEAYEMIATAGAVGDVKVSGIIAPPNLNIGSGKALYAYLNKRFIHDKVVVRAILDAYQGMLPKGRYPIVVLFIEMDPSLVDVNVHPQKYEVRFHPGVPIVRAINRAVTEGLVKSHIAPERRIAGAQEPKKIVMPARGAIKSSGERAIQDSFSEVRRSSAQEAMNRRIEAISKTGIRPSSMSLNANATQSSLRTATRKTYNIQPRETPSEPTEKKPANEEKGFFASLRIIGQALNTYIICGDNEGIILIDQHAAHERINYERISTKAKKQGLERQKLLIPERIELMPEEMNAIVENQELLKGLGFEMRFENSSLVITETPEPLTDRNIKEVIKDLLADLAGYSSKQSYDEIMRLMLATLACHSSVRAGRPLTLQEMEALLEELDATNMAGFCPHGRPVYFKISQKEIEKRFART